jgi:hypothetical protein
LRSKCKFVDKFIQRAMNWELFASSKYIPSIWSSKSSYSSNVPQKPHESSIFQQRVEQLCMTLNAWCMTQTSSRTKSGSEFWSQFLQHVFTTGEVNANLTSNSSREVWIGKFVHHPSVLHYVGHGSQATAAMWSENPDESCCIQQLKNF